MDRWESANRRVRAEVRGVVIADSLAPVLIWLRRYPTNYAVPREHVRMDLLREAVCEDDCQWFDAELEGEVIERIGWVPQGVPELASHIVLDWTAVDRWLEEDEVVLGHPRDPYTRCDPIHSTRHVQVRIDGTLVADSTRSVMLFETGLPTRYYLPADDVRVDLLEPSTHTSFCPYKGRASYHSVRVGEKVSENIVWYYREPFDEVSKIRDLLAFYDEQVEVTIDGVVQPQPASPWS
jgi:uncharacterized protein (DUF427 family)